MEKKNEIKNTSFFIFVKKNGVHELYITEKFRQNTYSLLTDPKLLDEKGHWYQLKEGEASKSIMSNGPNVATNRLSYMHR